MSYENDKIEVLNFFDNHILKYIIVDLDVLDKIKANDTGAGGCAIPQASSTFAALDLIGYLIHTQNVSTVGMSFSELLNNQNYFSEFKDFSTQSNFLDSFRDNIRSIMSHRFSLAKYDIAKSSDSLLFIEQGGRHIFNASFFTKVTIKAIKKIHEEILNDKFIINGFTKEVTMSKIKDRITNLKDFEGKVLIPLANVPTSSVTTQTTSSIG